MAFIDEIKFKALAGRGGDGVIRWRHEKFIDRGGPNGGDGGKGGDVYVEGIRDVHILAKYRHQKEFSAGRGGDGKGSSQHGADGEDMVIKLPIGSVVTNRATGESFTLTEVGEKVKILTGGRGGWGNEHFKSSINTTPRKFTPGKEGEEGDFAVELELFADVGLVGLPNAGKSSLLNALTNARAQIGDYAFTTLDPNLGDFYGHIIADIPGLIEGASTGKGLGTKFLRHIKRTRMIIHLVSFENELAKTGGMMKAYKEIRNELKEFSKELDEKTEIILLTKTDVIPDQKIIDKKIKEFQKISKKIYTISLFDDKSVKTFSDTLTKILGK